VRRAIVAAVAVIVLVGAGLAGAGAVGIGPLARPLPAGTVFVAISRNDDETDAREIEVIDLAGGERQVFTVDGRITALALSADRRSLYVALEGPRLVLLDARTGATFGRIDLTGAAVSQLVVGSDDRLYALAASAREATITPIDVDARRAGAALALGGTGGPAVGRPAVLPGALLIPIAEPRTLQLVRVTLAPLAVADRTEIPRIGGLPGAPAALALGGGTSAALAPYDAVVRGARLFVFRDPGERREKTLAFGNFSFTVPRGLLDIQAQAAASADGMVIQACVGNSRSARRYSVAVADLTATEVGTECGQMARGEGDTVLIAARGSAKLVVIDEHSGVIRRTLALAGIPTQLSR
jgi:hypothetical protein